MKTEMKMLDNGNYERVVCPIQHQCRCKDYVLECIEYVSDMGKLYLKIEDGDPYTVDGYSFESLINFCPFCGYQPERSKREDFYGTKASVSDGILTMDNGMKFDLNKLIEDAVL